MDQVKLFGSWRSPFSRRVETALKLKGVDYEFIEEDLANKSPLLLQYNPVHKKIPVLLHNGKPIAESLVILEYIDETWKEVPLLPRDPYERALARFWANFIDEKCNHAIWKAFWSEEKHREEAMVEAWEHLKTLENEVKDGRLFGGEKVGLLDIVGNFIGFWVGAMQEASGIELLTEEKFPILHKWSIEYANCGHIKENLPPRDKLIAFFRSRFESSKFYL